MNKKETPGEFLRRRRFEISAAMGRQYDPLSIREMAIKCDMNEFTLGRLEKDIGKPSRENMAKMAAIYGEVVYTVYGEPLPLPKDIDPKMLELVRKAKDNPAIAAVIEQAIAKAEELDHNKTVSFQRVTSP